MRGERHVLLRELRRVRHAHDRRAALAPIAVAADAHRIHRPLRRAVLADQGLRRAARLRARLGVHVLRLSLQPRSSSTPRRTDTGAERRTSTRRTCASGSVRAISSGPDGGVLHPRKRFYAGGANSVRGYAENQLGPRILTIDDSTLRARRDERRRRRLRARRSTRSSSATRTRRALSERRLSRRSRSAARRCSRAASSIACRCRSARRSGISSARCSSTAASSAPANIQGPAVDRAASSRAQGAITPGVGIRYESGRRTDSPRPRVQSHRHRNAAASSRPCATARASCVIAPLVDSAQLFAGAHAARSPHACTSRSEKRTSGGAGRPIRATSRTRRRLARRPTSGDARS